jgi:excisionase family DNA binding protein
MEQLLTVYEVAEALGVPRAKVDELVRTKRIAAVQVDRRPRGWTQTLGEFVREAEAQARTAESVFNAVRAWRDTENAGGPDTPASLLALQRLRDTVDIARAGGVL